MTEAEVKEKLKMFSNNELGLGYHYLHNKLYQRNIQDQRRIKYEKNETNDRS